MEMRQYEPQPQPTLLAFEVMPTTEDDMVCITCPCGAYTFEIRVKEAIEATIEEHIEAGCPATRATWN